MDLIKKNVYRSVHDQQNKGTKKVECVFTFSSTENKCSSFVCATIPEKKGKSIRIIFGNSLHGLCSSSCIEEEEKRIKKYENLEEISKDYMLCV